MTRRRIIYRAHRLRAQRYGPGPLVGLLLLPFWLAWLALKLLWWLLCMLYALACWVHQQAQPEPQIRPSDPARREPVRLPGAQPQPRPRPAPRPQPPQQPAPLQALHTDPDQRPCERCGWYSTDVALRNTADGPLYLCNVCATSGDPASLLKLFTEPGWEHTVASG